MPFQATMSSEDTQILARLNSAHQNLRQMRKARNRGVNVDEDTWASYRQRFVDTYEQAASAGITSVRGIAVVRSLEGLYQEIIDTLD